MAFWTVPPDCTHVAVSSGVGAGVATVGTVGVATVGTSTLGALADCCKIRSQYCSSSSVRASLRKAVSLAASLSRPSFFRVKRFRTRVFLASEICVVPMATRPKSTTADRDKCMLCDSLFLRFDCTLHETHFLSVLDFYGTSCLSSQLCLISFVLYDFQACLCATFWPNDTA